MKKSLNVLWIGLTCLDLFAGILPEDFLNLSHKTRVWMILGGAASLVGWLIISKFFSYILKKYKYYRIRSKRVRIGISIDDKDLNNEIVNYCNGETTKIKLNRKIVFEKYDLNYKDLKKVHNNISKKNSTLDLVVWMIKGSLKAGKVSINFTYKNTHNNLIADIVHNQMSSLVSIEKMFNLNRDTFAVDLHIEKQNIANFSLFIVAICTSIFRGNKEGIFIFEKLINKLTEKNSLKNEISKKLGSLYVISAGDYLAKDKFRESLGIYNKAYELIPYDRDLLAGRALAQYMNSDIDEAEQTAKDLLANHTNFPVAHLDIAFFRIKRKRYKNAIKHYQIFDRQNQDGRITLDAINFFSKRIEEEPSELGYIFARGFLKRTLNKDPKLTKSGESDYVEDFLTFTRRATGKTEYVDMIDVATKYLNKIPKNLKN